MRVITYIEFYRNFVQRKKQELLNPKFLNLSEISLPRNSLMHFYPRNSNEIGPSQSEALISTYGADVFIDFPHEFNPTIGVGKRIAFEWRKEIKSYRGKHYNYNWTKNIDTVYRKEKVLIVKSYGLIDRLWVSRPLMFSKFTNYYDKQLELIKSINLEASRGNRNQFIRIDLPNVMPSFLQFLVDYDHFVASFKDGVPTPNNKMVRLTKGEGSYWLLDFLALLMGDYKYTTYRELTPEAEASLHLVFTYNSRCLVLKLSVFKSWLEDLNKPEALELIAKKDAAFEKENQELVNKGKKPKAPENESYRTLHPRRFNVTKRIYLSLLNLVRGGVDEESIKDEETLADERGKERSSSSVVVSTQDPETKTSSNDEEEEDSGTGEDEMADTGGRSTTLADVLSVNKKDGEELSRRGSESPDEGADKTEVEEIETFAEADEEEEDYAGDVDDALLEEEVVKTEVSLDKNPFKEPASGVKLALEERAKEGSLSVAENKFFEKKANRYKEIKMDDGVTLEEFVKITDSEIASLNNDAMIQADIPTVLDPSMLKSRTSVLRKNYVGKFLKKDTVNMFLGLQNAGICLNDFKHEEVGGVEGQYDVYSIQVHPVDGEQSTHHIRIPKVDDSGMFTVDGVKSHLQLQRMERPIRKIDKDRVVLTSYYPNQLMLTRSRKVVDNLGAWMSKRIVEVAKGDPDISYSRGSSLDTSLDAPRTYSMLSPMFQWIKVGKLTLDFRYDKLIEKHPEFKTLNKKDNFLIGVSGDKPLTIDSFGAIMKDGEFVGDLPSLLKIDMSKAPIETVVVNISGYLYPIGVLLCYYFGIDELIKVTKLTTRSVPMGTRLALAHDEFAIPFNDEYLVFSRTQKLAGLIFGGMRKLKNISNFSRSDLNDKGIWVPLMGDPKVKPQHFLEMKNLYDLFIDPITKEELRKLKYSESFHYLLIDAVKLLEIDKTSHEVEIKEQRIVGYERFAGHAYRELCKSTRAYRNKGRGRKHKFELNPEAVITNIITDVSVNLVEEVNPVHEVKDQEELTFGGTGGRTDISIVKRARVQLESYRGVVSEANKDSGKIGFITYLTSDALVADYRGNIAQNEEPTKAGLSSITGNLAFGIGKDDPKRRSFISTQASQAVSAANYSAPITRTGYENVLPHRTSELYSKIAKEDGKVTLIDSDHLEVTYKDGTVDSYPLGLIIGDAAGEHHRHERITDLKVGDKFNKGEVLGWDTQWFQRDLFCPGQVVWKSGSRARIALVEDQDVFEDAIAISREFSLQCTTPYIKTKKFSIDVDQSINMRVKVGDEVDYESILCEVEDSHLGFAGGETNTLIEEVNRLGIKQVRSNHHGKVIRIETTYNSGQVEMSESVSKLISSLDKDRKKRSKGEKTPVVSGAVSTSMNVKRPMIGPGRALFTIYIESADPSTVADKYVVGNQMKCTVGAVMKDPLMTKDGRVIDVKNSFKGLFNRLVLSLRDKLVTNELAIEFTKLAIKKYRGE